MKTLDTTHLFILTSLMSLMWTLMWIWSGVTALQTTPHLDHPCLRDCDSSVGPLICEYDWTIEWYYTMSKACYRCPFNLSDCHRPHCVTLNGIRRLVLVVNRQIPGPSIQVCAGDIIKVKVRNQLANEEGTSIHWHGIHQRQFPYMDGVAGITQCPVVSGQNQVYEFIAETPGTHWWHSHSGIQRSDGMYGALIVRQTSTRDMNSHLYDVDDPSFFIFASDWTKETAMGVSMKEFHCNEPGSVEALLINGRGVYPREDGLPETIDRNVWTVTPGKRYRFRVIGASSAHCPVQISVDDHVLTVINMDGAAIVPYRVDGVYLLSGERYDFVLEANQKLKNYWMRVLGENGCINFSEYAIIRYEGAPDEEPKEDKDIRRVGEILNEPPVTGGNDTQLVVSDMKQAGERYDQLSTPDVVHYIEIDSVNRNIPFSHNPVLYQWYDSSTNWHVINNISFVHPEMPLLTHARYIDKRKFCTIESLEGVKNCSFEPCRCIHKIDIEYDKVVELVLINSAVVLSISHPFHLHGYYFNVLGVDSVADQFTPFNKDIFMEMDAKGEIKRNLEKPPLKDTIIVPPNGYTILRFRADNPGWWYFHCHFDSHVLMGMAMVFHVAGDLPPPPSNMPVCVNEQKLKCNQNNSICN